MKKVYIYGLFPRIVTILICVVIVAWCVWSLSILLVLAGIALSVLLLHSTWAPGVCINYKKGKVVLKIKTKYKWELKDLQTIFLSKEMHVLYFIVTHKNGYWQKIYYKHTDDSNLEINENNRLQNELRALNFSNIKI
jgi:Mn2+/Fe2+ NRAMP family transporter